MRGSSARGRAVIGAVLALSALASGCSPSGSAGPDEDPPASGTTATPASEPLSFGVYGESAEIEVWGDLVEGYNATDPPRGVTMVPDFTHDRLVEQVVAGQVPDVFLASRQDLAVLEGAELTQPVGELLDERGVDFGDGYSRDALQLFSDADSLQCMPLGVSPLVMFVNTDLIDLGAMELRGVEVPSSETQWTFDQFSAAVQFATRPRLGVRGFWVDPSVEGLAPYVLSAGGSVFDDEEEPTQLTLSDDGSATGVERVLQLARATDVSPTSQELATATPEQLFKRGRLAVLAGDRSMVPRLRRREDLSFDVREMPFLGTDATLGDVTGLCISSAVDDPGPAADFLVDLLRPENVAALTRAGSLVPSDLQVAQSEAFLQPGTQPEHSEVFLDAIGDIKTLPPLDYPELEATVRSLVVQLFNQPVIDLGDLLERIDERSRSVLDPEFVTEQQQGDEEDPASGDPTPEETPESQETPQSQETPGSGTTP